MLGFYFGSFDPIHENHIAVCEEALERGGCSALILIANGDNPAKPEISPSDARQALLDARIDEFNAAKGRSPDEGLRQFRCRGSKLTTMNWKDRFDLIKWLTRSRGFESGPADSPEGPAIAGSIQIIGEDSLLKTYRNTGGSLAFARGRRLLVLPRSTCEAANYRASEEPSSVRELLAQLEAQGLTHHIRVAEKYSDPIRELSSSALRKQLTHAWALGDECAKSKSSAPKLTKRHQSHLRKCRRSVVI